MKQTRVLVVDDNAAMRAMVRWVLEFSGYDVLEAGNGREGAGQVERGNPDLVITDIVMPEVEGLEFIFALRRRRHDLPVIAISGGGPRWGAETDYLAMASAGGAVATLEKPFSTERLLAVIKGSLQGKRGRKSPSCDSPRLVACA